MSSPLAGKFADHYEVFGVDPKANAEAIKDAYSRLAVKYSPANAKTGDKEKFAELNASYEVLCDPHLRNTFDGVRTGGAEDDEFSFPVDEFLDDLAADAGRRSCLLALLYHRRKAKSISPGISMRQIEAVMNVDAEQLSFVVWVLKQQGLVVGDDKSRLLITVGGIEYVERNRPAEEDIRLWLKSTQEQGAQSKSAKSSKRVVADSSSKAAPLPDENKAPAQAQELTGEGMATAGLSSLRAALQKSIGTTPAKTKSTDSEKAATAGKR